MKATLFAVALVAWSCPDRVWPPQVESDSPAQQPAGPELVSVDWLKEHLGDPNQVIVHIAMERFGYDEGHVPGAVFVPMGEFHGRTHGLPPPEAIATALGRFGITNETRVVLIGDPMSTAILFVALDYVGHAGKTAVLDGGLGAWRAAGNATSKESVAAKPGTFVPTARNDMIVDAKWMKEHLGNKKVALLDVRTRAEFDGTAEERLPRRGHIPGAKYVPWLATFDARDLQRDASGEPVDMAPEMARLLSKPELQKLFASAGAKSDGLVVTYCTVGMRASHVYFVSRLIGLPTRLYLGSMADWTKDASNPVVGVNNP
jgi:thiosulfate/3-mercaptopyruvate sulfurtransferase